jgi:hypothetical protein
VKALDRQTELKSSLLFRKRVFENGMLRRIFGPKRDEVTEEWCRLHDYIVTIGTPRRE